MQKIKPIIILLLAISGLVGAGFTGYFVRNIPLSEQKTIYFGSYINRTHHCYNHNKETCSAELKNLSLTYRVSSADGTVAFNGQAITGSNGFFDLSVPIEKSYSILISAEINGTQYDAYTQFASYYDSPTCVATGQFISKN